MNKTVKLPIGIENFEEIRTEGLKGVSAMDFAGAKAMLRIIIGNEAMRFRFLMDSPILEDEEKENYRQLIAIDPEGRQKFSVSDDAMELPAIKKKCKGLLKKFS